MKCFDDVTIDFMTDSKKIRKWTAFLGINGVGKSILLQAITLSLIDDPPIRDDLVPNSHHWVRKKQNMGEIDVIVSLTNYDRHSISKHVDIHLRYLVLSEKTAIKNKMYSPRIIRDPENLEHKKLYEMRYGSKNKSVFCSYGPYRRLPNNLEKRKGPGRSYSSFENIAS